MYYLLEFLRKYYYVVLFLVLEAVSFALLFRFNSFQGSVYLSSANAAAAAVDKFYGEANSYLGLRSINADLTQRNIRLQMENERLRRALEKSSHEATLTEQTVMAKLAGYELIEATVVSATLPHGSNYLVIDRGEADGVRPEMGVVGGGGVVGIVYLTGPHHALVIPVTNRKSNISCRIEGQDYFGYLSWNGGSLLRATVEDIPRYAKVRQGAVVETSGFSSVFPPGIFVGRIKHVSNSSDGQSYKLDVALGTDFSRIRNVSVIATPYKAEIDTLYRRAALQDMGETP